MKPTNYTSNFTQHNQKDLEQELKPPTTYRTLKKDVERKESLPAFIAAGTRTLPSERIYTSTQLTQAEIQEILDNNLESDNPNVVGVPYLANSQAGDYSLSIPLGYDTTPLALLWSLGERYDAGVNGTGAGAGLMFGTTFSGHTVGTGDIGGVQLNSGSMANYHIDKDYVSINITSTNVGIPSEIMHYFYVAIYYDDSGVKNFRL